MWEGMSQAIRRKGDGGEVRVCEEDWRRQWREEEEKEGKEEEKGHTLLPKGFKPALILSPPTKAVQSI